jgi:hypothetical protein
VALRSTSRAGSKRRTPGPRIDLCREITVDGRPRTYDHKRALAIEAAKYLKLKNPAANVTVRDLEGTEETIIIPAQQPRVRR